MQTTLITFNVRELINRGLARYNHNEDFFGLVMLIKVQIRNNSASELPFNQPWWPMTTFYASIFLTYFRGRKG